MTAPSRTQRPTLTRVREWLRVQSSRTRMGTITPECRRGYLHALDDMHRWVEHGGQPPSPPASDRQSCATVGHEGIPADYLGVYDDGDHVEVDVAYCGPCATSMAREYRVTRALASDRSGS